MTNSNAVSNRITVVGNGSVMAAPDIAYLNVGVETRAPTASAAQQANAEKFAAVEQVLFQQFRIDPRDVQTTVLSVHPEYEFDQQGGRKLIGYVATHMIRVAYRKLSGIGALLDALTAAGVNRIGGIEFGIEHPAPYEAQALRKAMADAKLKAEVLASSAGREVRGVSNIVEGRAVVPPPIPLGGPAVLPMAAESGVTSVQAGEIKITADVTVQYFM